MRSNSAGVAEVDVGEFDADDDVFERPSGGVLSSNVMRRQSHRDHPVASCAARRALGPDAPVSSWLSAP